MYKKISRAISHLIPHLTFSSWHYDPHFIDEGPLSQSGDVPCLGLDGEAEGPDK